VFFLIWAKGSDIMIRLLIFAIIFYMIGAKWPVLAQKIGIV